MTRAELLAKLYPWRARARAWGPIILCVVLALLLIRSCQAARSAKEEVKQLRSRAASEQRAREAGVPVVVQAPPARVDEKKERMLKEVPELRDRLDKAEKALGKLRAELVVVAREAGKAEAPPRPGDPPACPGEAPCLLRTGDGLTLGVHAVVASTPEGAYVLEGTLDAVRDADGAVLLRRPLSQPVAVAREKAPPASAAPSTWRWGPMGGWSGSGWLLGVLAVTPEVRLPLVGLRTGLAATAAGGPGGVAILGGITF